MTAKPATSFDTNPCRSYGRGAAKWLTSHIPIRAQRHSNSSLCEQCQPPPLLRPAKASWTTQTLRWTSIHPVEAFQVRATLKRSSRFLISFMAEEQVEPLSLLTLFSPLQHLCSVSFARDHQPCIELELAIGFLAACGWAWLHANLTWKP